MELLSTRRRRLATAAASAVLIAVAARHRASPPTPRRRPAPSTPRATRRRPSRARPADSPVRRRRHAGRRRQGHHRLPDLRTAGDRHLWQDHCLGQDQERRLRQRRLHQDRLRRAGRSALRRHDPADRAQPEREGQGDHRGRQGHDRQVPVLLGRRQLHRRRPRGSAAAPAGSTTATPSASTAQASWSTPSSRAPDSRSPAPHAASTPTGRASRSASSRPATWSSGPTPSKTASGIHHVALYIGNGQIVEADRVSGPDIRVRTFSTSESGVMPYVVRPIR